jgi:hypothetical protein
VCQGGERGQEEGAFELLVAAFGRMLAADGAAGAAGDRGEAGVGGQVTGGGEGGGVADFEEDAGAGPDSDAGHRGQDLGKRVRIEHPLDLRGDLVAVAQDIAQRVSQAGQDRLRGGGSRYHDGLLAQCGKDLLDQARTHTRRPGRHDLGEFRASGFA